MPRLNVAILMADSPAPRVLKVAGGDYGYLIDKVLKDAAEKYERDNAGEENLEITTTAFDVFDKCEYPEKLDGVFDALLITGSASSPYEDEDWINRLVQYVADTNTNCPKVKMIGICFGHQIIARALGGKIGKNQHGWEVGWTEMTVTEEGKRVLGKEHETMSMLNMHVDHVVTAPRDVRVLTTTALSPNQTMLRISKDGKSSSIITIQGHPEYTPAIITEFLEMRVESGVFTEEFVNSVKAALDNENDSKWFARIVMLFLLDKL